MKNLKELLVEVNEYTSGTRTDWTVKADGYSLSTGTYKPRDWNQIGNWLMTQKNTITGKTFDEEEVEEILRSKWMRWAGDSVAPKRVTLIEFIPYFKKNYKHIIDMLQNEAGGYK